MLDTENQSQIICPWCGYEYENSWEYEGCGDIECYKCNKNFQYEAETVVNYNEAETVVNYTITKIHIEIED